MSITSRADSLFMVPLHCSELIVELLSSVFYHLHWLSFVNCSLQRCDQIFKMILWNYGPEVMDALIILIIALVSEFYIVLQLPSSKIFT